MSAILFVLDLWRIKKKPATMTAANKTRSPTTIPTIAPRGEKRRREFSLG